MKENKITLKKLKIETEKLKFIIQTTWGFLPKPFRDIPKLIDVINTIEEALYYLSNNGIHAKEKRTKEKTKEYYDLITRYSDFYIFKMNIDLKKIIKTINKNKEKVIYEQKKYN